MKPAPDWWMDAMPEADARRVLGDAHFDWSMRMGAGYCANQATARWQSNMPESYAAYKCAERLVNERAAQHE